MPLRQSEYLEVKRAKGKGKGVFARVPIPKGTVFERAPLLVVKWADIEESSLADYAYSWTETTAVLALGYGSLYNHSFRPNACYEDVGQVKEFRALRNIEKGEEVTVNYNGDPKDRTNIFDFEILD